MSKWGLRLALAYIAGLLLSHFVQIYPSFTERSATEFAGTSSPTASGVRRRCTLTPRFGADGPIGNTADYRVCWHDYGQRAADANKPVVLLLHGSPGRAQDLGRVARALQADYHPIAIDLIGSGDSGAVAADYGVRAQARSVLAVADALGAREFFVFAHSLGGGTALQLTSLAPSRVRAIVAYGAVGSQEGEGSGSYALERIKYFLGYGLIVVAPELVPHFGLLGARQTRHTMIRNFIDTDMRPLGKILSDTQVPILFLHGADDPLVPLAAAESHFARAKNAQLEVLDASHFLIFSDAGSRLLARQSKEFYRSAERANNAGKQVPRTVRRAASIKTPPPPPVDLNLSAATSGWAKLLSIILGTLVSEDLTCISTGLLVRRGLLDLFTGLLGCYIGIFLGDIGLFLTGRLLRGGFLKSRRLSTYLTSPAVAKLEQRFEREGVRLLILSRFVPGMRLPVYLGAGFLGGRMLRMTLVALAAGLVWTPALVILSAVFGEAFSAPLTRLFGESALVLVLAALLLLFVLRLLAAVLTSDGRQRLRVRWGRARRPEFWPPAVFYAPLVPLVATLSLRYRGFATLCASNPAIPAGGFIGESKLQILDLLPEEAVIDYFGLEPGKTHRRQQDFLSGVQQKRWEYPIILKPDVGQRGLGLRLVKDEASALQYISEFPARLVVQRYHPGPFEAGVFYVRFPNSPKGKIFSITDKVFPIIEGDGQQTLEALIYAHPRFYLQAETFLARLNSQRNRVLAKGERCRLAIAGNHCQGTLFKDGAHLITPELEAAIDSVARKAPGIFFGRFDLRYSDRARFCQGKEIAIVELNGATAESTNIFDPARSLWFMYGTLFRQWILLYQIGYENRKRGVPVPSVWELLGDLWRYRKEQRASPISD